MKAPQSKDDFVNIDFGRSPTLVLTIGHVDEGQRVVEVKCAPSDSGGFKDGRYRAAISTKGATLGFLNWSIGGE